MKAIFSLVLVLICLRECCAIWCYKCVSHHPGCGLDDFDWRYFWGHRCTQPDDVCVKIIEQKGSEVVVTRDCLSDLEGHRRDIPNDRYEGCRSSAQDPALGNYIFPSIVEIDNVRLHYDNTTFCFCTFDERCNDADSLRVSVELVLAVVAPLLFTRWQM